MKNLIPILVSAALLVAGCTKKEDPTPTAPDYSQLILGKWVSSSTSTVSTTNGQSTTTNSTVPYGDVSEVFTATTVTSYYKTTANTPRSYSISGNSYTIDDGGGASRKFEIVTLSSTSFVRKYTSTSGNTTSVATTSLIR